MTISVGNSTVHNGPQPASLHGAMSETQRFTDGMANIDQNDTKYQTSEQVQRSTTGQRSVVHAVAMRVKQGFCTEVPRIDQFGRNIQKYHGSEPVPTVYGRCTEYVVRRCTAGLYGLTVTLVLDVGRSPVGVSRPCSAHPADQCLACWVSPYIMPRNNPPPQPQTVRGPLDLVPGHPGTSRYLIDRSHLPVRYLTVPYIYIFLDIGTRRRRLPISLTTNIYKLALAVYGACIRPPASNIYNIYVVYRY